MKGKLMSFPQRLREACELINDSLPSYLDQISLEYMFHTAGIDDTTAVNRCLTGEVDVPEVWKMRVASAFGINTQWLLYGYGKGPFSADSDRIIRPGNPMDILRTERLSQMTDFHIGVTSLDDQLHVFIVRCSGDYCYELYPKAFPFFSTVGAGGTALIVSLYRFINYARKLRSLDDLVFYVPEQAFIEMLQGSIPVIRMRKYKSLPSFVDLITDLPEHVQGEYPFSTEDLPRVFSIIKLYWSQTERINHQGDWSEIKKNNPSLSTERGELFKNYIDSIKSTEDDITGIENDEIDDNGDDSEEPYDVEKIIVEPKQITVFQIEHWINNHMLDLSPEYQRHLVWDIPRKSALIESMMLKIPIPAFYLDEHADGTKSVIDGMQRLNTIHEFISGKFALGRLHYLSAYNNKKFNELDSKYRSRLEETVLHVNILDSRCPDMVKFDVFRRVNTGGIPLNPQEIRNVMAAPTTRELLNQMIASEEFNKATLSRVNDARMKAQELCLRFLTVSEHYNDGSGKIEGFTGLRRMMDAMILQLNGENQIKLSHRYDRFREIMEQCSIVLGNLSFSRNRKPFLINKILFVAWTTGLEKCGLGRDKIIGKAAQIREKYLTVLNNDNHFIEVISVSTNSKKNIEYAIGVILQIIGENDDQ